MSLVSPALISNLNVHNSVGLPHVNCKLTYFLCDGIHLFALDFSFYLIGYPERCLIVLLSKGVKQSCETRWNSRFLMLESVQQQYQNIQQTLVQHAPAELKTNSNRYRLTWWNGQLSQSILHCDMRAWGFHGANASSRNALDCQTEEPLCGCWWRQWRYQHIKDNWSRISRG